MREVTGKMIKDFRIMENNFDFMSYKVDRIQSLSFHHLIIPHRESRKYGIGDGYVYWNGSILRQNTSHDYLHTIEIYDYDAFLAITSEMIDMKNKGYLDKENLLYIRSVLESFEREHCSYRTSKGKPLIKKEFIEGRVKF